MDGIGSQVLIDESGNRYGDYSLLAMVENDDQQFKFKVKTRTWTQCVTAVNRTLRRTVENFLLPKRIS